MFRAAKTYEFSSAHNLTKVEEGHPCANVHGHNYTVEVVLAAAALNEQQMVLDFRKLDETMKPIIATLDHSYLNEVLKIEPTVEVIAAWFMAVLLKRSLPVERVRVSETGKTWGECDYVSHK